MIWLNIKHSIKQNVELKIVSFSTEQTLIETVLVEDPRIINYTDFYKANVQGLHFHFW